MGLFKPNVENLKARKNAKGLIRALKHKNRAIRGNAAEALEQIGVEPLIQTLKDEDWIVRKEAAMALGKTRDKRAVEPLIQALKNEDQHFRHDVAKALGEIGNTAVQSLIQALKEDYYVRGGAADALDEMEWKPSNDMEKAWYLYAKGEYDELSRLGKPAAEPLIRVLGNRSRDDRRKAAEALGKIGDLQAAEPIIKSLYECFFNVRTGENACNFFESEEEMYSWSSSLVNIFGDYTKLIAASLFFQRKTQDYHKLVIYDTMIRGETGLAYDYDFLQTNKAIEKLCEISTQISTNLLTKISQLEDMKLQVSFSFDVLCRSGFDVLSFQPQRRIAKEELMRRGNPPYDPSAYLDKDAWKL